jgi:hypothetical protein
MSQRLTLGRLRYTKNGRPSRISVIANVCPDDDRIADWVNGFQERALNYGRWWGTTQLARLCVSSGCNITLPREVAVIEAANLNGSPMSMGNSWNPFVRPHSPCSGDGWRCRCCGCSSRFTLQEKDPAASFATTTGTNKKIRVYSNVADNGKKIVFQGYDSNGIWVRTFYDGAVQDGEQLTLTAPYTDTATVWGPSPNRQCVGAPVRVIKELTNYRLLVYSVNTDNDTMIQIAEYQAGETNPSYRVVSIPGFRQGPNSCGCETSTLSCIVSLQHIPVINDTDFLLFQNPGAYMDGVIAEKYYEAGEFAMADAYFFGRQKSPSNNRGAMRVINQGGAIPSLQAELRKMTGDVTAINIQYGGVNLAGFR